MLSLRSLADDDVERIRAWPAYAGDMAPMDYALREEGWLDEFRARPGTRLFAFEADGDLVAFALLSPAAPGDAEFRIAIRADRTGLGLGEEITRRTLAAGFGRDGLSRIHLIVRKNNLRGLRLYRRVGFTECGERVQAVRGVPVEFVVMEIGRKETGP